MTSRIYRRALLPLLLISGVGMAQKYEPLPPPLTVDPCAVKPNAKVPADPKAKPPVCPPPAPAGAAPAPASGAPSAADQFPFPGGTNAPAVPDANPPAAKPSTADQFPFPGSEAPATPNAPAATPATPQKKGSAADQFSYPGETSKSPDAVPEGDTPRYVPDSPVSGAAPTPNPGAADDSSSSSSSSSPTADDSKPADTTDSRSPRKGRRALPKVSAVSPDERVTKDLDVAKFYSSHGNYEAAYLRSKDAITVMPDDAESHFRLAQAAQKLKKNDEAITEYNLYLKLDPGGDWAKDAQEALSELQKGG